MSENHYLPFGTQHLCFTKVLVEKREKKERKKRKIDRSKREKEIKKRESNELLTSTEEENEEKGRIRR